MDPVIDEAILLIILQRMRRKRQLEEQRCRRRLRFWTHPLSSQRLSVGYFAQMFAQLRSHPEKFVKFTRMSVTAFDELLEKLRPRLTTNMRRSVSPEERLLVTLRFFATGQSFVTLHHHFPLGVTTISKVTRDTCAAIWEELHAVVMPEPTEDIWESVVDVYWQRTQFPNCIGALKGKLIRVKKPPNSTSYYLNSKKYFSVVLLALVDSNLKFLTVDVGEYGSQGNSRIFRESAFGRRLHEEHMDLPPSRPLPLTEEPSLPLVMVADETFALSEHLMRPYSGCDLSHEKKIFNYRLSCVQRVAECAFGVCTGKWRVLLSCIQLDVQNAIKVVLACCVLHNFLRDHERSSNVEPEPRNPGNRVQLMDLHTTARVMAIRDQFSHYFVSPDGEVSWQEDYI